MPKQNGYLMDILSIMCADAIESLGEIQSHTFSRGASVKLYIDPVYEFHLKVWRLGDWPGEMEWETFIRFLPDRFRPATTPIPERKDAGATYAFIAHWTVSP